MVVVDEVIDIPAASLKAFSKGLMEVEVEEEVEAEEALARLDVEEEEEIGVPSVATQEPTGGVGGLATTWKGNNFFVRANLINYYLFLFSNLLSSFC